MEHSSQHLSREPVNGDEYNTECILLQQFSFGLVYKFEEVDIIWFQLFGSTNKTLIIIPATLAIVCGYFLPPRKCMGIYQYKQLF